MLGKSISEYLRPWIATPRQAVDSVDCGRPQRAIKATQPFGLAGLDESQRSATPQASGNLPAAIQFLDQKVDRTDSIIFIPPASAVTEASRRIQLEVHVARTVKPSLRFRKRKSWNEEAIGVGDWDWFLELSDGGLVGQLEVALELSSVLS